MATNRAVRDHIQIKIVETMKALRNHEQTSLRLLAMVVGRRDIISVSVHEQDRI